MSKKPNHHDNLIALRRIEGQVRGVQRMIQDRRYFVDILNQIYTIKGALARVEKNILKEQLQHSIADVPEVASKKEGQQTVDEILKLIHQVY